MKKKLTRAEHRAKVLNAAVAWEAGTKTYWPLSKVLARAVRAAKKAGAL